MAEEKKLKPLGVPLCPKKFPKATSPKPQEGPKQSPPESPVSPQDPPKTS